MAFKHWHPGKLVMIWLVVVAWDALILAVVTSGVVVSDPPATFLVFVFGGPAVSVVTVVLTWKWFTARETRD